MSIQTDISISIDKLSETTSTNDYLAALCKKEPVKEFRTIVADFQTGGKGQRGNVWESDSQKNLLFSTLLYPTTLDAKSQFYLSMLTALSIVEVLSDYTDGFSIKWPNDIYWKDKKIAGILIENELEGKSISQCIIGIGLNVNQASFQSSIPNPISLYQILGTEIDRYELLTRIISKILANYMILDNYFQIMSKRFHQQYLDNLYRKTGLHAYQDAHGVFKATFHHIEPDGHLYLKDEEGNIRRYAFKEVTYLI